MSARERLAALLPPGGVQAAEELMREIVHEEIARISKRTMNGRQRSEFLTVGEAADLLRSNRQRVYDLCSAGRLTKHKDGSRTLIRRAELEAHLAAGREGA